MDSEEQEHLFQNQTARFFSATAQSQKNPHPPEHPTGEDHLLRYSILFW